MAFFLKLVGRTRTSWPGESQTPGAIIRVCVWCKTIKRRLKPGGSTKSDKESTQEENKTQKKIKCT
uniref:Uncharacterized protein n=1 Tax=Globisporangium ultimum (strain ATCC 200006 / CBS 805.95 / DAOM BR144) TaxID=431595 RepID=K3X9X2_GLOUD